MAELRSDSAAALGPVAPKSDNARRQPGAIEGQGLNQRLNFPAAGSTVQAPRVEGGTHMPWLIELPMLAARFGHGVGADLAALTMAELWGVYAFLRALAGRGG